jgi:hypothetical protein
MSNQQKLVSVVILGWNGKKYLQDFLPTVVQFSTHPDYEIVYADNCSTDDSVAFVKENFPTVRIVQNTSNKGFAGGYNDALKQVNAKYFVLLNQDVAVTENWIEPVIALLESDEKIAAAQPKLLAFHQKNEFEYAGAAGGYVDYLGYPFCRGRLFDAMEKDLGQYNDVVPIFWASGACKFVRSAVYWQAGGLDEDFFAHQEEIDLCWRIQNLGYQIYYQPKSTVYHVGGGSLPQGNPRKTFLNFRNNLIMLTKNLPASEVFYKVFLRFCLDGLAGAYSVVKNKNFKDYKAILKAHLDFLNQLNTTLQKRKTIAHKSSEGLFPKSIIWNFFVKGKRKFSDL